MIVFNAKVTVETGGLAAAVFGIASGGWGWNRVEEATSEALEIWQAWFR